MITAASIPDVLNCLDEILAYSRQHQNPMGYFAMLYRRMTVAVREGIANKQFDDPERMESLDVTFANRYLQAWDAYCRQQHCSNAWYTVFEACGNKKLVVLQHLMAGVNTHINLDLGVAAAEVAPGEKIWGLQQDFDKINLVIASLTAAVEDSLCNIWAPLRAIRQLANGEQDAVLNFSISTARKTAWANAVALAFIPVDMRSTHINTIDAAVVTIGNRIIHPGMLTEMLLVPVRQMENMDISKNMELLAGPDGLTQRR
jgi:hypothetical protein